QNPANLRVAPDAEGGANFCHSRPGMTVIELVVVVALMGIMAAVVAPSFASFDRRAGGGEHHAADRNDDLLRSWGYLAVERAKSVDVTIDPSTGRFWVDPPDSAGMLELPEGTVFVSRGRRVHVHIEPNGEATIDEVLFVRRGDSTVSIDVSR